MYVLVSSFTPLKVYIYEEGLVRFAGKKYSTEPSARNDLAVHLTSNSGIQDKNENNDLTAQFEYSKCDLEMLKVAYTQQGIDYEKMQEKFKDIIIKTLISGDLYVKKVVDSNATNRNNCFSIYAFDMMVDDELKPWLLKVNCTPSLESSQPTDKRIKTMMVCDALTIVGIRPYQKAKVHE